MSKPLLNPGNSTVAFRIRPEIRTAILQYVEQLTEKPATTTDLLNSLLQKGLENAGQTIAPPANPTPAISEKDLANLQLLHKAEIAGLRSDFENRIFTLNKSHAEETDLMNQNFDKMQAWVFSALQLTDEQAEAYENWKNNQLLPELRRLTNYPDLQLSGQEIFSLLLDYAQTDPVAEMLNILQLTPEQTDLIEALRFPRAQAFETIFLTKINNYERDPTQEGGPESSTEQQPGADSESTGQESSQEEGSEKEIVPIKNMEVEAP